MTPTTPLISIVCPAYQEEEVLPRFHERLAQVLAGAEKDYRFEVIYVDDGSSDGTLAQMRRLAQGDPRVEYVSLSRNFGKEAALTAGLAHARGDAVITMDTDLQHPPDLIPKLLAGWRAGHDIVRTERLQMHQDSLVRRVSAALFHRVMQSANGERQTATSDYQLLSRRVIDALAGMPEIHRYLRGLVSWLGFSTTVVLFEVPPRAAGTSRFTTGRLLALASDGVLSFSRLPLRLSIFLGLVLLLLALLDMAGVALWAVFSAAPPSWGLHVLATLELVLAGFILIALGIVGEYVGRIYEQVKQRPIYLLKEASPGRVGQLRADPSGDSNQHSPWSSTGASAA
jgi:dolichol-phosphate mannosyltransferase